MKRILPSVLIATFLLTACAIMRSATQPQQAPDTYNLPAAGGAPAEQNLAAPEALPPAGVSSDTGNSSANGSGVEASSVERLVIQNADLAIVVSDVEGRMKEINDMAKEMGGFVVSSNLYQSYTSDYTQQVPEGQIVVRVPVEKLEDALKLIKQDVVEVQSETRSGQDVTAEYVDLKSRLKNLESAEAQLDEIMKQATQTEDVVNVFNQLVYYREQIEVVKGQIKYYEEAAALSAISVRIIAEETIKPIEIGPWQPKGVALKAIQDLVDFSKGFVEFLIRFVLYTLPVLIMIGIPLYLVFLGVRAIFRKLRGNKPRAVQEPLQSKIEDEKKKKK
jgi:hypothetical protein